MPTGMPAKISASCSSPLRNPLRKPPDHKQKKRPIQPLLKTSKPKTRNSLQRGHVLCLPALGSLDDIELHGLAFLQAAKAFILNGGVVHEHVLAILPADETVSLGVVEPLHCSLFHKCCIPSRVIWLR